MCSNFLFCRAVYTHFNIENDNVIKCYNNSNKGNKWDVLKFLDNIIIKLVGRTKGVLFSYCVVINNFNTKYSQMTLVPSLTVKLKWKLN